MTNAAPSTAQTQDTALTVAQLDSLQRTYFESGKKPGEQATIKSLIRENMLAFCVGQYGNLSKSEQNQLAGFWLNTIQTIPSFRIARADYSIIQLKPTEKEDITLRVINDDFSSSLKKKAIERLLHTIFWNSDADWNRMNVLEAIIDKLQNLPDSSLRAYAVKQIKTEALQSMKDAARSEHKDSISIAEKILEGDHLDAIKQKVIGMTVANIFACADANPDQLPLYNKLRIQIAALAAGTEGTPLQKAAYAAIYDKTRQRTAEYRRQNFKAGHPVNSMMLFPNNKAVEEGVKAGHDDKRNSDKNLTMLYGAVAGFAIAAVPLVYFHYDETKQDQTRTELFAPILDKTVEINYSPTESRLATVGPNYQFVLQKTVAPTVPDITYTNIDQVYEAVQTSTAEHPVVLTAYQSTKLIYSLDYQAMQAAVRIPNYGMAIGIFGGALACAAIGRIAHTGINRRRDNKFLAEIQTMVALEQAKQRA